MKVKLLLSAMLCFSGMIQASESKQANQKELRVTLIDSKVAAENSVENSDDAPKKKGCWQRFRGCLKPAAGVACLFTAMACILIPAIYFRDRPSNPSLGGYLLRGCCNDQCCFNNICVPSSNETFIRGQLSPICKSKFVIDDLTGPLKCDLKNDGIDFLKKTLKNTCGISL